MALSSGLIAYYKFSNNYNDSSGNSNNLTNTGTTSISDKNSVANQAIQSTGSTQYALGSSLTSLPNALGDVSISFWANWQSSVATGIGYWAVYLGDTSGANNHCPLGVYSGGSGSLVLYQNSGAASTATSAITITADTSWHHYVAIRRSSGTIMELYQDGVLLSSQTVTARNAGTNITKFAVNANHNGSSGMNNTTYYDEVRIYTRAISTDEITALYNGYDNPQEGTSNGFAEFGGF